MYCQNGSDMSFVEQEPGQKCVCEVPYPRSMLSEAGYLQQLNRTTLKSVSGI